MNVGIFGGTFDPFTTAHREIAKAALDSGRVDELRILPTAVTYHRPGKTSWLDDVEKMRCIAEMMRSLGGGYAGKTRIDARELALKAMLPKRELDARRTWHVVNDIKADRPNDRLFFIVGTDSALNFKTWYRWKDVLDVVELLAVDGRNSASLAGLDVVKPENVLKIDSSFADVSASGIRARYSSLDDYLRDTLKAEGKN